MQFTKMTFRKKWHTLSESKGSSEQYIFCLPSKKIHDFDKREFIGKP